MGIVAIIKAALSLMGSVMGFVRAERQRGLGAKEATLKGIREAQMAVDKAREAREQAAQDYDPDTFNRDK